MLPLFPNNTRELIEQMILMDGRIVTMYNVATLSGCSVCDLDPITDTSTDSFCPTCSGMYWIPTYSGTPLQAHVTWGESENKEWQVGGMLDNGDCTVKFMHTDLLESLVYDAKYFVVDGRTMNPLPGGIILRGIPQVNRVIVKLREKER